MSKFDFTKAFSASKGDLDQTALMAVVLGPSGAGKSTLCGTFGVKTLYIYTAGESHGPKAASAIKDSEIVPLRLDDDPNVAYQDLLQILGDAPKEFKAVVLDGATEIEQIIRSTQQFRTACLNSSGKHNSFAEGEAVLRMFRPIVMALKDLSKKGVHSCITCALDVQSMADDGEILESKPRLSTYSVVEGLLQQFPAYFCVGRMVKGEKRAHRIQFLAGVSRVSKDQVGSIKKTLNFNPRISGVLELPNTISADLKEVIKLMEGKGVK
jgi:energy-coupling factor transporter ATP-binding protein EcfA2